MRFLKGAEMTDKELRKLKRAELLEILFYLRKELDELQAENAALTERIDELTKSSHGAEVVLSEESRNELLKSVRSVVEDCLAGKAPPGRKNAPKGKAGK